MIDIDASIARLTEKRPITVPDARWVPFLEYLVTVLNSQHHVQLEILRELRTIRERMSSDTACGFKSRSEP